MDEGTLEYFRVMLNARLNEVGRDIVLALSNLDHNCDNGDPMDEVDATANRSLWEVIIRIQDRSRKSACEINTALQRIRLGNFGICEECGESIGLERLKAYPMTSVCIQCNREVDKCRIPARRLDSF